METVGGRHEKRWAAWSSVDCGKRKAEVRARRGEVVRKWRKRSYKKKEGPGDPVVKRREATALGDSPRYSAREEKEDSVRPTYRAVIGFLTFCLSVAAAVIRARVGSVLGVCASSTGLPCLALRMK